MLAQQEEGLATCWGEALREAGRNPSTIEGVLIRRWSVTMLEAELWLLPRRLCAGSPDSPLTGSYR